MKEGDKLICINSVRYNTQQLYINDVFTIDYISPGRSVHRSYEIYYLFDSKNQKHIFNSYNLKDYFATLKENRKQKLEKLNGIQN